MLHDRFRRPLSFSSGHSLTLRFVVGERVEPSDKKTDEGHREEEEEESEEEEEEDEEEEDDDEANKQIISALPDEDGITAKLMQINTLFNQFAFSYFAYSFNVLSYLTWLFFIVLRFSILF